MVDQLLPREQREQRERERERERAMKRVVNHDSTLNELSIGAANYCPFSICLRNDPIKVIEK
jgi:hypothetical protein